MPMPDPKDDVFGDFSVATTERQKRAEQRRKESTMSSQTKLNPARSKAAAKMYPSLHQPDGQKTGHRVKGDEGDPRFQNPSAYRVATTETAKALRAYPSMNNATHYDAKVDGKNPDGSDRVLIRSRRDAR